MSTPQAGEYYYHFKRDPEKGVNHHAYRIIGTGVHTETEEVFVVYQSLYKEDGRRIDRYSVDYNIRPLSMFCEDVSRNDYQGPRFQRIQDEAVLEQLKKF